MHGRGREQTENREGSGWPYMARPWCTASRARGCPRNRSWGPLGGARLGQWRSWSPSRSEGGERGSGEGPGCRACEAAHWSSRAAGTRVIKGSRRKKEVGDQAMACRGRRGASTGVLGRPEVDGCAVAGLGRYCSALQNRLLAGMSAFCMLCRVHLRLECAG